MAGAGYKLFTTGSVLTAAEVNTYLQEQTVMVFADAAARTTALSGVVSEGMISYLKDTNAVEVYDGSNWVSSDDPNAIQNTIVDAKGDLITATAADTPSRIAVGNNGETLVADSSATTGLRWQSNFAAGKNKIINGDFNIKQRSATSTTTNGDFIFDRWSLGAVDGTSTYSLQQFTPGTAPVAGYESTNYAQLVSTGQTLTTAQTVLRTRIEDVRNFAGQTVTLSFWAVATASTNLAVELLQVFGTGGSPSATVTGIGSTKQAINTTWTRYSFTISVPSISGKTIGTDANSSYLQATIWTSAGSSFNSRTGSLGIQSSTIGIWGVQLEAGNVATAFQTATGTLAGELAACQRYYWRQIANAAYGMFHLAVGTATTTAQGVIKTPSTMRIAPTSVDYANIALIPPAGGTVAITNFTLGDVNENFVAPQITVASGLTQGTVYRVAGNNNANAYVGFSSEL